MTSPATITGSVRTASTRTPYQSSFRSARVTFSRLVHAEWIALYSLPSTYVTILMGGFLAFALSSAAALSWRSDMSLPPFSTTPSQGILLAQIAAVLVGGALYARESSTGALSTQLAATPRRVSTLSAKAAILFFSTFILGALLVALSLAASATIYTWGGRPTPLDPTGLASLLIGGGLLLGATSVLGLGIATIVRSEPLTMAIVLALLVIVPALLPLAGKHEWVQIATDLMFAQATAELVTPITHLNEIAWQNLTITAAWPALALCGGAVLMARRGA